MEKKSKVTLKNTDKNAKKLLVFDDEPMVAKTISEVASREGFLTELTHNAVDFFLKLDSFRPDVIILDLIMPEMDGIEVLTKLEKMNCTSSIIISSGVDIKVLSAAAESARDLNLHIIGTLEKPFSFKKLSELLNESVNSTIKPARQSIPNQNSNITSGDLSAAINDPKQIKVVYQPKIFCRTGTLAGFEALARWHSPKFGIVNPYIFIQIAEQNDLIDELTKVIIGKSLDWLAGISTERVAELIDNHQLQNIKLSLNISAKSLGNTELFDWVYEYCKSKNIAPDRLVLELTESSAMQGDLTTSLNNLTRLRIRGFHLSIDDFGTGFSSMVQLVRLPFSEIKVDKSFVMESATSTESKKIVKSIVDLGISLGLNTTAEGVENQLTLDFLNSIGCELAQGYFISPPIYDFKIIDWFKNREVKREKARLISLHNTNLIGSEPEERFDRITRLAKRLFDTPIALITVLDESKQWFKSKQGFDLKYTSRTQAFCNKAIQSDSALIVHDATKDPKFSKNPLVLAELKIRFYAGQPLSLPDGNKIGTLCIIDNKPREFNTQEIKKLKQIAKLVEHELAIPTDLNSIDFQTGLLSRDIFRAHAEAAFKLCKSLNLSLVIFSIQISGLDDLNKTHGNEIGNKIFKDFAEILQNLSPNTDLVGRYRNSRILMQIISLDFLTISEMLNNLKEQRDLWLLNHPIEASVVRPRIGVCGRAPDDEETLEHFIEASFLHPM